MIHGVLLDSIGLALFSLAWWGWLIGGGLAVVGMLFGVHVAVGAPEAQAYSSSSYTLEEAAARGDVGAMAQLARQSQPGYSGPSKEAQMADALSSGDTDRYLELKGDTQAQLANSLSSGDVGAGASYAQQMQQESGGTSSGSSSSSSSPSSTSAYDAAYSQWEKDYAQWEKDMAAWEAQYGSGGGGGGGAPVAPSSSPNQYVDLDNSKLSELFPDPYDYSTHVQPDPSTMDYAQYFELLEEAKRQADRDKPFSFGMQTWSDRVQQEVEMPDGGVNDAAARALARDATSGTIAKHGDITNAIVAVKSSIAGTELDRERHPLEGFNYDSGLVSARYLVAELEAEYAKQQAAPPVAEVAFKAKGAQVDPTYTASDDGGTLDIAMKAKARAGSTVKIQVMEYNADKGRMVVVDTTKAKVGKGGKIHTAVEADAGDVIMVKKNTGKKLAQIEIPGQ